MKDFFLKKKLNQLFHVYKKKIINWKIKQKNLKKNNSEIYDV
jgi:hypothetical protein